MLSYLTILNITILITINIIIKNNLIVAIEPTPYIIGGTPSSLSAAPYIVSIQFYAQHFCGGSLITPCYVVTAAHCLVYATANLQVRANTTTWNSGGIVAKVRDQTPHPQFNNVTFEYDFGLISLLTNLNIPQYAQLPTIANGQPGPATTNFLILGWGTMQENGTTASTYLMSVTIPLIPFQTCNSTLTNMGFTHLNDNCEFCAGETGKDTCRGDSGGPCIRTSDNVLIGTTSYGFGCGQSSGGVYAKLIYALDWLQNNMITCPAPKSTSIIKTILRGGK